MLIKEFEMNEGKNIPRRVADTANPSDPETLVRKTPYERLDRLETVLLDDMTRIASSMAELATLSLLEESFPRIRTVAGRLDQEVQTLKNAAASRNQ